MTMTSRSSGNLQADRRYSYARDYLKDGDFAAAADLFGQALELAPLWAPALVGLGEALEKSGQTQAAIIAYRQARAREPSDELGAGLRLARLGAADAEGAMTAGYVAALFDEYAPRFDAHLTEMLNYRGPKIIMEALQTACAAKGRAFHFTTGLDLGCGTGLMAKALQKNVTHLDGVDLSPVMVEVARKLGAYRKLWVGDVVEALSSPSLRYSRGEGWGEGLGEVMPTHPAPLPDPLPVNNGEREYDLFIAADVLVYLGDLAALFHAAAKAMKPEAFFAFTVQVQAGDVQAGDGFGLGADLRYHHSITYITATAHAAGLQVLHSAACVTREDAGKPVPGMVVVLEHAR